MKSSPKLYNFDALYENCKETFENPKGTPLQKKSKFRKKISVVCLNVEFPTGQVTFHIRHKLALWGIDNARALLNPSLVLVVVGSCIKIT